MKNDPASNQNRAGYDSLMKCDIDGLTFARNFPERMVKLTCEDEVHNGITYHDGENVDVLPWNPRSECQPGGLYFCAISEISRFLYYGFRIRGVVLMVYIRSVFIQPDARVYVEPNKKFKANKFFLGPRQLLFPMLSLGDKKRYVECYVSNQQSRRDPAMQSQMVWDMLLQLAPSHVAERVPSPSTRNLEGCVSCIVRKQYHFLRFMPADLFVQPLLLNLLAQHRVPMHFIPMPFQNTQMWSMVAMEDEWWENSKTSFSLFRLRLDGSEDASATFAILLQHGRIKFESIPECLRRGTLLLCHEQVQQDNPPGVQVVEKILVTEEESPPAQVEPDVQFIPEESLVEKEHPEQAEESVLEHDATAPAPSIKKRKKKARASLFTRRK